MPQTSQTAELIKLIQEHRPGCRALAPQVARALVRHAKALHRLYERECNEDTTDDKRHQALVALHEKHVAFLAIEVGHHLNGDPRGFPVKLHFGGERQPHNTWGGVAVGWGIG
jgi:hypothetical protein